MEQLSQFISNNALLFGALIIILVLIFIYEISAQKKQATHVTPQELVSLMNKNQITVIDIRDQQQFGSGHIIGAINATETDFTQPRMQKYKGKPIAIVCARGIQAMAFASKLREQKFDQVMVLSGGIAAWQGAELPLDKKKTKEKKQK